MFVHTILWNFQPGLNKDETFKVISAKLLALKDSIKSLKRIEIAKANPNGSESREIVLITYFDNEDGYLEYAKDEEHQKVRSYLKTVIQDKIVCDAYLQEK